MAQHSQKTTTNTKETTQKETTKKSSDAPRRPLVDLDDLGNDAAAQWDVVNRSGVLHKLKAQSRPSNDREPHLLAAILMAVPLTLFHAMLDYIVHHQFGFLNEFTLEHIIRRELLLLPALIVLLYITGIIKHWRSIQFLLATAAAAAGSYLVHITTVDETFGAMLHAPGLAAVWICLVIQMDIAPSFFSLLPPLIYSQKQLILHAFDWSKRVSSFAIKNTDL